MCELEASQVLQNSGKLDLQVPVSHKAWTEVLTVMGKRGKMTVIDQHTIKQQEEVMSQQYCGCTGVLLPTQAVFVL